MTNIEYFLNSLSVVNMNMKIAIITTGGVVISDTDTPHFGPCAVLGLLLSVPDARNVICGIWNYANVY